MRAGGANQGVSDFLRFIPSCVHPGSGRGHLPLLWLLGWLTLPLQGHSIVSAAEPVLGIPATAQTNLERLGMAVPPDLAAQVAAGEDLFLHETFAGNGRTCASCHPASNNTTLDPQFIAQLNANDPLFVAETDPNLALLEQPSRLRTESLIVTDTVDGLLSPGAPLRTVPHLLSLALTTDSDRTPLRLDRTGWSGDGAPGDGTLRSFASGAIRQHLTRDLERVAGRDFRPPSQQELDAMLMFLLSLGPTEFPDLQQLRFADPLVEAGRLNYLGRGRCQECHQNGGGNFTIDGFGEKLIDVGSQFSETPADLPADAGFGLDPNPEGGFGDGRFVTPAVIFAADTPPFFHNGLAETLFEAVEFYESKDFRGSPANTVLKLAHPDGKGIELETTALVAFLTALNSLENIRSAIAYQQRAAGHEDPASVLATSLFDLGDAIDVLNGEGLYPASVNLLETARDLIQQAIDLDDLSLIPGAIAAQTTARDLILQPFSNILADFDGNGIVAAADIDLLAAAVRNGTADLSFDLDGSSLVDSADIGFLVETLLGTQFGDANLDGTVTASVDAAVLLTNLGSPAFLSWADGDFNGDTMVTASGDGSLLLRSLNVDTAAVPEPSTLYLAACCLAICCLAKWRRSPLGIHSTERRRRSPA